ncbi:MAG: replication initiation protein [bacterium]
MEIEIMGNVDMLDIPDVGKMEVRTKGTNIRMNNRVARGRLFADSIYENRIWAYVISCVRRGDINGNRFSIKATDVCQQRGKAYEIIKKATKNLKTKNIFIEDEKGFCFISFSIFDYIMYKHDDKIIECSLGNTMLSFLLNQKKLFTLIPLEQYLSLGSIYSQYLFQFLCSWQNQNKEKSSVKINVKGEMGLYDRLGLLDDDYNLKKYSKWSLFNKMILSPAIDEIHKKTDMKIKYKTYKIKNRVSEIEFMFIKQCHTNIKDSESNIDIKKLTNLEYLDKYYDKGINEISVPKQKEAIIYALKKFKISIGVARKIADKTTESGFDYKTKILEKTIRMCNNFNSNQKDGKLSAYIVGSLYKELGIN